MPKTGLPVPPGTSPGPDKGKPRKPHRFRPGTVALREIRKYQTSTNRLAAVAPLIRMVRDIADEQDLMKKKKPLRFSAQALEALHEISEDYLCKYLERAYRITIARGKPTLMLRDMKLLHDILDEDGTYIQTNTQRFGMHAKKVKTAANKKPDAELPASDVAPDQ